MLNKSVNYRNSQKRHYFVGVRCGPVLTATFGLVPGSPTISGASVGVGGLIKLLVPPVCETSSSNSIGLGTFPVVR